jgi:multiple sugar transport system permease protein
MLGLSVVSERYEREEQPFLNRLDISDRTLRWVFMLPSIAVLAFISIFPTVRAVWMSLHNWSLTSGQGEFVGFGNYAQLINDPEFFRFEFDPSQPLDFVLSGSVVHQAVYTGFSVGIELILGIALAMYLFSLSERWQPIFRTIFVLPMLVTPIATALMWRLMIDGSIGILNFMFQFVGVTPPAWTSTPIMAMITVIIVDVWQWTPLVILIVFAGLLSIPESRYEAARVDGAPRWAIFRHVTLPGIKYMIAIALVFRLMRSFRSFPIIETITSHGPGTSTQIMNIQLYRTVFVGTGEAGLGAALGIVLVVITVGICMSIVRRVGMME